MNYMIAAGLLGSWIGVAQAASFSLTSFKDSPMTLSYNDFAQRYGAPDQVLENADAYSHLLRYEPGANQGTLARAFFISNGCVAVLARYGAPVPALQLLPDEIVSKLQGRDFHAIPREGKIFVTTESFDNYWAFLIAGPVPKTWNAQKQQTEYGPFDLKKISVAAIGMGDKDYFLDVIHRVPEMRFITSEDYFRPGAYVPEAVPTQP